MARLNKHGKELLRIESERDITDASDSCTWERYTRTYMSDGNIMQKMDVRFKPDTYRPNGEFYSYGWKLYRKLKPEFNMRDHAAKVQANLTAKPEARWKVVTGGLPIVVISQARIIRAIESGDSLGFCKACGSEAYNVEPDARNYVCESCGQREVYGAEEMLIAG